MDTARMIFRDMYARIAVSRNGLSISMITNTGSVSTKDLHHIYDGRIKNYATLVTDKMNSYVRFTNDIYAKESDTEIRNIFLSFVLATLKTDKCRDLPNRPAVLLVA